MSDDLPLVLAAADLVPEHLLRQRPLDRLLQLQELGVVSQVGQRVARPQLVQAARVLLGELGKDPDLNTRNVNID